MRTETKVAALAGAAAAGAAYYLLWRKRSSALPVTLMDKKGDPVIVRLAVPEDVEAVKNHIADHTGMLAEINSDPSHSSPRNNVRYSLP